MLKHVLVPLDGSNLAEAALEYATQVVDPAGQLTLFTVINLPELPIYDFYPTPVVVAQEYESAVVEATPRARDYLKGIAENLRKQTGASIKTEVSSGDAALAIVEAANNLKVDAIVMSTHGRSGLGRWLFGSVTQKVLSTCDVPVMVIPSKARHAETEAAKATTSAE